MTKYFVTQVFATEGPRSATEPPTTVSPTYPRLETAQNKALWLAGLDAEDADWWANQQSEDPEDMRYELHRPNGSWTGFAVRQG